MGYRDKRREDGQTCVAEEALGSPWTNPGDLATTAYAHAHAQEKTAS